MLRTLRVFLAALLAQNRIAGALLAENAPDERLGGTVHLGHHVGRRRLGLDRRAAAVVAFEEQAPGVARRASGEIGQGCGIGGVGGRTVHGFGLARSLVT